MVFDALPVHEVNVDNLFKTAYNNCKIRQNSNRWL